MRLSMKNRWAVCAAMLIAGGIAAAPASADDADEVRTLRDTTIALVKALVEQGVLTQAKADELIRKAEEAGRKSSSSATAGNNGAGAPAAGAAGVGTSATAAGSAAGGVGTGAAPGGAVAGAPGTAAGGAAAAGQNGQPPVIRVPY